MAIINNLKVFANTLTSASEGEFAKGVSSGGYIYADTLNTALRTSSVVTYALIDALKELGTNGAYTISAISTSTNVKNAIKDGLQKLVSGASVAYATKAGSATSATTATSAGTATTATTATKLAEGVGSATEPVYVDTDGTVKKCTGINVPGSVTSATNVTNTIAGKKITDIFESDGTTAKLATYATSAGRATTAIDSNSTYRLERSGDIAAVKVTDIFESDTSGNITSTVKNATNANKANSASESTDAYNVTNTIGGKSISNIFESDGVTVKSAIFAEEARIANAVGQALTINVNGTTKTFDGSEAVSVNTGNVAPFKGTVETLSKTATKTGSIHYELNGDQQLSYVREATLLQIDKTMSLSSPDTPSFEIQVTYQTSTGETTQTLYRKMSDFPGTIGSIGKMYNYDDVKLELFNCSVDKDGETSPSVMYNNVQYIDITIPSETNINSGTWKFQLVGTQVV